MAAKTYNDASKEIDAYINAMPAFSQAICKKLRSIILHVVPGITEDWKWGPNYNYHGMVCGYGAFQKHVKLTFFNGNAMKDDKGLFNHCVDNEFSRSVKYTDVKEIEEKSLASYIKESAALNEKGYKRIIQEKKIEIPNDLLDVLNGNKTAFNFFDALKPGYKKEYIEWITEAKKEETRKDRISKTLAKCAAGERLNDKYKKIV